MQETEVDLLTLFNSVSKALKENQATLNEADTYNHNHGDNMVNNFKVINKALKQKPDASLSERLAFASQKLAKNSQSASAQLYSQNLALAADRLQGQPTLNSKNAMSLIQALMGGQTASAPAQPGAGDLLGSLLGAAMGGGEQSAPPQSGSGDLLGSLLGTAMGGQPSGGLSQQGSGDLISSLLGSLLGGGQAAAPAQTPSGSQSGGGMNFGALLSAGMAYMNATQQGASPLEGLIQAVMSGSQLNNSAHQSQSGQLVAGTLINTLGSLLGGK